MAADPQHAAGSDSARMTPVAPSFNPDAWVDGHGDALFMYAMGRLRDRAAAEDAVQETFLAALQANRPFRGDSTERTWLIGILRHKIIDHLRRSAREHSSSQLDLNDPAIDRVFDAKGMWVKPPAAWPNNPETAAERNEFWDVFRKCMDSLPKRLSEIFALRMMDEATPEDVCKDLQITPTNIWVMLHRARARLRECLEGHWFNRLPEASQTEDKR